MANTTGESSAAAMGFAVPAAWAEAADGIASESSSWPPPILVVCGPGNCGKSAFSRVLLNALLRSYKTVGYLDTDVGQPEFTPPGFVSLHAIKEQTTDLTMLYLRTPMKCFFFGHVSAQEDPELLQSFIFGLYDYFLKEFYPLDGIDYLEKSKSVMPLIINTSGWVTGFGYDMLVKTLRHVSPTHVVKLCTSTESKNLPSGLFWLDKNHKASVNLVEICSAHEIPSRPMATKKEARILRDARLIGYFRQCLPRDLSISSYNELIKSFASICPFELSLSNVKVVHLHCQVPDNTMYHSLSGTIVGLAVSSSVPSSARCSTPWCIGLGFVKSVNILKKRLCLITPVPRPSLEKVDLLWKSTIAVPTCLLKVVDMVSTVADRLEQLEHLTPKC